METIPCEFGQLEVLYRHPDFDPEQLAYYVTANATPACVDGIKEGRLMNVAMWRGLTDNRYPDHRMTSWASTKENAEAFTLMCFESAHREVKFREQANVIAIVLHEDWLEYIVIEETA